MPTPIEYCNAYRQGDARVGALHAGGCFDVAGAARLASERPHEPLAVVELEEWRGFLRDHGAADGDLAPLDALASPDARIVVTGQQAGAAMGPLLGLYKALAARHWAAEIARASGRPVVPVFWVASDDHDLAEIATAAWLGRDHVPHHVTLAGDARGNRSSVYTVAPDPQDVATLLDDLSSTTHDTEFRPGVLEALEEAFAKGATFEAQFVRLAVRWLLPLGIVPVVPRLGFLRRRAAAVLGKEINGSIDSNALIAGASERLRALGVQPPLHRAGDEVNFFLEIDGTRAKLRRDADAIVATPPSAHDELARFSQMELAALLESDPGRFSPNAVLRPLVQDHALPTVVSVLGPTELVYHAQIGPLYEAFRVPRPGVWPRPHAVLVETSHLRAAEKLGIALDDLPLADSTNLKEALARAGTSADDQSRFDEAAGQLREALDRFQAAVHDLTPDTGARKAAEKAADSARTGIERTRDRFEQYLANRDTAMVNARGKLEGALLPGGHPQERALGPLAPLLVNHGADAIARIAGELVHTSGDVQILRL